MEDNGGYPSDEEIKGSVSIFIGPDSGDPHGQGD